MLIDKTNVINSIKELSPSHIVIGYSGGVDSSVLLNICKDIEDIPVIAIYINHNIHHDSIDWQKHCQDVCNSYDIKFISHCLGQSPKGESFEAWASSQRMNFFQRIMQQYPNPLLLLGHHQDDQAETFLIQAMRGSGLAGLAGIPYYKKLDYGAVLRPLIDYKKTDIEAFAKTNNLSHIYDDSNKDNKYRRNLIRNEVIPILQQINPNISGTISRSANICAQSNSILNKLLTEKLDSILQNKNIVISKLKKLDSDIQKSLIHFWFKQITNQSLKSKQVKDVHNAIKGLASTGWSIEINKQYKICIQYNQLLIKHNNTFNSSANIQQIQLWLKENLNYEIDFNSLIIRDRKPSDKCKYPGRNKPNKLKIIFQELKIPADERAKIKIIEQNSQIIAIYPFFVCG